MLWTDGAEHKWVEECGTMNIMFVTADGELVTPRSARSWQASRASRS
ncbi:hypothetical protein [Tessaracoccus coleopterorum]